MENKNIIYLDNSATTRISEVALAKYTEVSLSNFGNPSSLHTLGSDAEKEMRAARRAVTDSLMIRDGEVIFTSSGSEANNLAIIGRAEAKERYARFGKIITTEGEHASVTEPLKRLEAKGFKIAYIPTRGGRLDLEALRNELTKDVILVTLMLVNNETGALYDIKSASDMMRAASTEAILHVDATQGYMKVPFTMKSLGCDMITLSSHKIRGPKGVGALVIDPKIKKNKGLAPIIFGGGQESGMRSGTENVPGIAAFGAAIKEEYAHRAESIKRLDSLRSLLIEKITKSAPLSEISITLPENHAPHILNLTLPSIKSETMLHYLSSEGIYVSSGSACSSNSKHLSSALIAYGRSEAEADTSIRISFGVQNTEDDVEALCEALASGLQRLSRIR